LGTLGLGVGSIIGIFGYTIVSKRISKKMAETDGDLRPEHGRPPMIVGSFCMPIGLFWYGKFTESKVCEIYTDLSFRRLVRRCAGP
jgi:hypothetical protein